MAKLFQCMSRGVNHEDYLNFTTDIIVALWHLFMVYNLCDVEES